MHSDVKFHLHLETVRARPRHLHLTKELWDAAAARHRDPAERVRVTVGFDGDILGDALKTADFTIDSYPPKDRLAERAPRLKWIQTTGAGIETLLPLDWLPSGVTLTNNRGAHGEKAEDSCTLALLAMHTRFADTMQQQRDRVWKEILTPPIAGRTAVVVGFGDLGQGAGRAAHKLGLRVVAVTRSGKPCPPADEVHAVAEIDRALPLADFLIVTTPLTPETRGLIDKNRIGLLKKGCGVVNIGRAAVMDYAALRERLESGDLGGAVLDVFEEEPLPPSSPWWTTRNVIVTPHISCDTPGYMDRLLDRWFENFERFLAGKPLANRVDRQLGY
jgi:phosphoglycerate dehydrogenase-like enzyme